MLHCNMKSDALQLGLEDLLADLQHARRTGDLGRLAFVAYCEVRRWARHAGETALADRAARMVIASPHINRDDFLAQVDQLISDLQQAGPRLGTRRPGGDDASSAVPA